MQFSKHEIKQNSAQIPKFFPFAAITHCQNSPHLTLFTSQKLYFVLAYLYQKDERALPGRSFRAVNAPYL
jgi:hypothetical protein